MTNQELDPSVEVVHLRRLLDTQPSCLMRLSADGVVLAANDAALTLLGMTSHAQALGKPFTSWIPEDQRDRWAEFARQVVHGSPASIECDLTSASGDLQATLFHGVPLAGHPDGLASMVMAARAVTGQRQLEAAMVEREELLREFEAQQAQARERLGEADAHRRQLEERVGTLEALLEFNEADSSPAPDADLVRQLKANLETRDQALAAADEARRAAESEREEALGDSRRLQAALQEFTARHQQVLDERAAERNRVLQMLDSVAARHRQELEAAVRTLEAARAAAQAELDEARAGCLRLETEIREAGVRHDASAASAAAECARLQQSIEAAEARHRIERQAYERDAQLAIARLESRAQDTATERDRLQTRLDQALVACQECEADLSRQKSAHRELVAAYAAATAERDRLVRALREQSTRLTALADQFQTDGDRQPAIGEAIGPDASRDVRCA